MHLKIYCLFSQGRIKAVTTQSNINDNVFVVVVMALQEFTWSFHECCHPSDQPNQLDM